MNVAQQDRIAQRELTCPRCGAEPGKRCWEKARGNPGRKTYLAWPHAERVERVQEEHGLAHALGLRPVPTIGLQANLEDAQGGGERSWS
jgi:hypothetical protein